MYTNILNRLVQFHSDKTFDASRFNEHRVEVKRENYVKVWRHALSSSGVRSKFWQWFMAGDALSMMCENFHMKTHLGMTANQWMKWPMFTFFGILTIGFIHTERCHSFRNPIHGPFHSLICSHSKGIFHMKFCTHHQQNITNHKPLSKFVYYVTGKKCMTSNLDLFCTFYLYLVFTEAWRIKSSIRMDLDELFEDVCVHNLQ